jgi:hypothetical protein
VARLLNWLTAALRVRWITIRGDAMAARVRRSSEKEREQDLLDEALEETFPASDTPSLVRPGGGITGSRAARRKPKDTGEAAPSRKPARPSPARG